MTWRYSWSKQAACHNIPAVVFYPEKGERTATAKAICALCPVRRPCLQYALDHDERFGVWGGLSERERRRLRRVS
jgi:WhiB family transcriptional regulator, redox-sensing transcriptional regulator